MCGICGRFAFTPIPTDEARWQTFTDRLWRRGPDDRGVYADDRCVLGARRLAIMDTSSAGHLPMSTADGVCHLAFNGELYNFESLRPELIARGHRFRSRSDSEVVLAALREWGTRALDRFDGVFALAYYDSSRAQLLLARDHAGIKPLYVLRDPRGLVFSSEFDQLATHPWAARLAVDSDAVAMYLRLGHIPAPRAYLRNTAMLPPGTWLSARADGRVATGRWFQFEPGRGEAPDDDLLADTILRSVTEQARSDVPVGCFLSGGIDAPLVAAHLAETQERVRTFSVAIADSDLDESAAAVRYARALGSEHRTVTLADDGLAALVDEALAAMHEPLADEGILPTLLVSRLAARSVTVALSGEGGDELFWGYTHRIFDLPGEPADGPVGHRYLAAFNDFGREAFSACFPSLPWWPDGEPGYDFDVPGGDDLIRRANALRRCEYAMYLPFVLLKSDRASMHHSLEVRVPLLSRAVVSASEGASVAGCVREDTRQGKLPLRRLLARRLGMTTPGKKGFTAPMDRLMAGPLSELADSSARSLRGFGDVEVDAAAVQRMSDAHRAGELDYGMALWRIACLDRWADRMRDTQLSSPGPV